MDRHSPASLTYRIITEALALVMVAAVLVLGITTNWDPARLSSGVITYFAVFSFLLLSWWQLSSMYAVGAFRNRVSSILGMVLALNFALTPLWLGIFLKENEGAATSLAHMLLPVSFACSGIIMAVLIRLAQVYQSKHQWRLVHHSLWITSLLLLATAFIPKSMNLAGFVSVQALAWLVISFVPLAVRRLGVSLVATPARPPSPRPAMGPSSHSHAASGPQHEPQRQFQNTNNNEEGGSGENRERRNPSRRGGYYRRRQGGGRRRM